MTADQIALEDAKKAFDMMEEATTDLLSDAAQYKFWEYIKKRAEDELEDSDVTGDELDELDEDTE